MYTAGLAGLPDIVPAYLDPEFQGRQILTGASFASAASGYDDVTARSFVSISSSSFFLFFNQIHGNTFISDLSIYFLSHLHCAGRSNFGGTIGEFQAL